MNITIIMALAEVAPRKYAFGTKDGKLPWNYVKADMQFFVQNTKAQKGRAFTCSMATYNSLPTAAIQRLQPLIIADSREEVYEVLSVGHWTPDELIVLGGRKLIHEFIPYADVLRISQIGGVSFNENQTFLREETLELLKDYEMVSSCYFHEVPETNYEDGPYLQRAYSLVLG